MKLKHLRVSADLPAPSTPAFKYTVYPTAPPRPAWSTWQVIALGWFAALTDGHVMALIMDDAVLTVIFFALPLVALAWFGMRWPAQVDGPERSRKGRREDGAMKSTHLQVPAPPLEAPKAPLQKASAKATFGRLRKMTAGCVVLLTIMCVGGLIDHWWTGGANFELLIELCALPLLLLMWWTYYEAAATDEPIHEHVRRSAERMCAREEAGRS